MSTKAKKTVPDHLRPTQEEIAERSAEIRRDWTGAEMKRRSNDPDSNGKPTARLYPAHRLSGVKVIAEDVN